MQRSNYSWLERCLHRMVLGPAAVSRIAFQLERQFALADSHSSATRTISGGDGAVYVCGLARSGTTLLLHLLSQLDDFRSLTYRDMPFVLAPNLWRRLARRAQRPNQPGERVHGDGVIVDFDSPEAFEEVFWRMWQPATSFAANHPETCEPSAATLQAFAEYRAIVANPSCEPRSNTPRRYLSKNNNNLLRLRALCADPTATVLLMYREPCAAARSLLRQHQQLSRLQHDDGFVRSYMGWLGHHEFGVDQQPFHFATARMTSTLPIDSADYWLDYWNAVHAHLLAQSELRLQLVSYDELCAQPQAVLQAVFDVLGVQQDAGRYAQQVRPSTAASPQDYEPELLERAAHTYQALQSSRHNVHRSPRGRAHHA